MKLIRISAIIAILSLLVSTPVLASSIDDIGYTALHNRVGTSTPTGAGVRVAQVEAPINDVGNGAAPIFMPDSSHPSFIGKTITAANGNPSGNFSTHANGVGELLYGHVRSIASGVTQIDSYDTNAWLNSLATTGGGAPTSVNRVTNHSWIGGSDTPSQTGRVLLTVDRLIHTNESIQVAALANGSSDNPLLGSAYNVISVGRTDGGHQQSTVPVAGESLYETVRTAPALVAPESTTSLATPVVSAAAALLVQTGHEAGSFLSKISATISGIGTIHNAEQSETIKAVLMAGADRQTFNTSISANITDYRSAGHETTNGLDSRYGAGQVNIDNSYQILTGGEQDSVQDGGGDIASRGFDYGTIERSGFNQSAGSYFFNATSDATTLFASLVWNLNVSNDTQPTAQLYNLDLALFDVTNGRLVADSASTLDNTENVFFKLLAGNRYEMRVTAYAPVDSVIDYALAWRMDLSPSPVPLPSTVWLFGSGLVGVTAFMRRCRSQREEPSIE